MKNFLYEVNIGLSGKIKKLNPKWLYDFNGSKLFEEITRLEEYYVTRTEIEILKKNKKEIANLIGEKATVIEPGAGESKKISIFLKSLKKPNSYVPSDISKKYIRKVGNKLKKKLPKIKVNPMVDDFTMRSKIDNKILKNKNIVIFFPGSTIGNFDRKEAIKFLKNLKLKYNPKKLIIGVDLIKKKSVLLKAYNDKKGITAKFNINLLKRINKELKGNFNIKSFKHTAIYNKNKNRIEMHLVSLKKQKIKIQDKYYKFKKGETIHTESSHKYSPKSFSNLANKSGWKVKKIWTDINRQFSVQYLI
tara:strand:+ start:15354 stop:16268 length:915 start_codon:yes stop_codon:yes gene_type:complete